MHDSSPQYYILALLFYFQVALVALVVSVMLHFNGEEFYGVDASHVHTFCCLLMMNNSVKLV